MFYFVIIFLFLLTQEFSWNVKSCLFRKSLAELFCIIANICHQKTICIKKSLGIKAVQLADNLTVRYTAITLTLLGSDWVTACTAVEIITRQPAVTVKQHFVTNISHSFVFEDLQ